jgi:hypothetical protein
LVRGLPAPPLLEIVTFTRWAPRLSRVTVRLTRLPTVARVLRVTRTHPPPFLRSTVICTVAARLVDTLTVAERFFTRA